MTAVMSSGFASRLGVKTLNKTEGIYVGFTVGINVYRLFAVKNMFLLYRQEITEI